MNNKDLVEVMKELLGSSNGNAEDRVSQVADAVMKSMLLCLCVAYDQVEKFPDMQQDLMSNDTENGAKLLKLLKPIIKRTPDTPSAFIKDIMFTTRDFAEKLLAKEHPHADLITSLKEND